DAVIEALRRLKALGVEIHMDDFGTGYSSLSYLHRLPLDVLKIDRAFMNTLSADNSYADVVHTVVALARTLQMRVTVEGVETQEQVAQVRALDCDFAQGFYFSTPLSPDAATRLIASGQEWLREAA
ncbi:MAG: EAL domain-containing protein, partial [Planctomycetota bacterium]